ncbi:MAG: thioredoxin family protein [Chloroflexota bacterium]
MDRLAEEWGDQVEVVRVNIHEEATRPLTVRYGFQFTPTFVLLDGDGREVWRDTGGLDVAGVKQAVSAIQ